ncbi:MAG: DNA phosphorothioation-associated putative methyltransferase [Deltaproteobacteria bacterium]|nr:MAG: DNA phosphorothioation-associated putative methyltransferase [Deltaproteobacteria bacterium]
MGTSDPPLELYPNLVAEVSVGKRLLEALYLHVDGLPSLPQRLQRLIAVASDLAGDSVWNVVKLSIDAPRISFLHYPRFFDDGFPALRASTSVDLATGSIAKRAYDSTNPPILHRKELMLPPGHHFTSIASALTATAEQFGLFDDAHLIGHRQAWDARLGRLGLRLDGHQLLRDAEPSNGVQRHKTALTRYSLSTPMQALWRHGFLAGNHTVCDYGCGRGDDLRALQANAIDAVGWDPHWAPDGKRRRSAIVNLGFVLNVIEDPQERSVALRSAWDLAEQLLVVSVLIGGRSTFERFRLYSDGVITARNTFQRYFTTGEFREYVEGTLAREPIMLAPGIAFVFRDDADEQEFLSRRTRRRVSNDRPVPRAERPERPESVRRERATRQRVPNKWETNADLVNAFWERCLELGRVPESDEFPRSPELRDSVGTPATVFRTLLRQRGESRLTFASDSHRDDLLVFLALNVFERRKSFGALPESARRDIKAFSGGYQSAQTKAQELLFSTGKARVIEEAARIAASRGLGFLDGDHSLQFHSSLAQELPPVLRVYLGCAARLYGDVETADVIKLHLQSGKVSILLYDDFEGKPLPRLIERVKINLRRQQIDFFEYGTGNNDEQLLYLKSRFIKVGFPFYEEQVEFDRTLTALGEFSFEGFGPSHEAFMAGLARAGVIINGFQLSRLTRSHPGEHERPV